MGNFSGISLEFVGKSDVFVWECVGNAQGLLGNDEWGIDQGLLRIIWETVGIHREPLENLWGLSVRNTFVGRGPNTNRAHPHACNIPYKTALPVPCTHRFYFSFFLSVFSSFFLSHFWEGF